MAVAGSVVRQLTVNVKLKSREPVVEVDVVNLNYYLVAGVV